MSPKSYKIQRFQHPMCFKMSCSASAVLEVASRKPSGGMSICQMCDTFTLIHQELSIIRKSHISRTGRQ